jgi:hypothetical protein
MSAVRRRTMADLLSEQQRDIEDAGLAAVPSRTATATLAPAGVSPMPAPPAAAPRVAVPDPYLAVTDGQLSPREHDDLATCESALDNLRLAFTAAGKALQVIRDARLYRETHTSFEEYLAERWEMSRPQAYRLIEAWPLAQRLSPMGDKLNERQVRELLPLADRHGQDAAAVVYQTVAEADGVQVTAAVLHGAVSILPADHFDPSEAVSQIRAYLAGAAVPTPPTPPPGESVKVKADRLLKGLHQVAELGALKGAEARQFIDEARAVLDQLEQSAT